MESKELKVFNFNMVHSKNKDEEMPPVELMYFHKRVWLNKTVDILKYE